MKSLTGILAETRSWIFQNRRSLAVLAVTLVPVAVFFTLVGLFSVNIPYNDDYETVLGFMNDYVSASQFNRRFDLIVQPWNEHRIVFSRLITIVLYRIAGHIDFRTMILVGNTGLLMVISALFYLFSRKNMKRGIYFLPAVLLFFQPSYNENILFGMAALANFFVLGFGFLSIAILSPDNKAPRSVLLPVSLTLSLLSYYTQANGILYLVIGLALLLYQKRYREGVVWFVVSAAAFAFYSLYQTPLALASPKTIDFPYISRMALYFFSFIGNVFGISAGGFYASGGPSFLTVISGILPIAGGIFVCGYFIFLTVRRYDRTNPVIYALFVLLFLTAAGAAYSRGSSYGVAQALTSRYRVVTILFYILGYLSLLDIVRNKPLEKKVFALALSLSLVYNLTVYALKWQPIRIHRQNLIISMDRWKISGSGIDPLAHPSNYANRILRTSVNMGIYKVPDQY